ncbi:hypothetical protein APHAL10511_006665 [Amanita phalloides]|nr:hypothetical protein APHAL10511_006665 [Amanita phalloides]
MSSAGFLVPQREHLYTQPVSAAPGSYRDSARTHHSPNPGHVSPPNKPFSAQVPYSHVHTESIRITSTRTVSGEDIVDGAISQQVSTVHVVAVHTEDEQLVSHLGDTGVGMLGDMLGQGQIGPPPPSPPASVEREILGDQVAETYPDGLQPHSTQLGLRLVASHPLPHDSSSAGSSGLYHPPFADTKDSLSTLQPPSSFQFSPSPPSRSTPMPDPSGFGKTSSLSLPQGAQSRQPSTPKSPQDRPTRRNTTGSSPGTKAAPQLVGSSRGHLPSSSRFGGALDDMGSDQAAQELASEIQQAADQIRRERRSKRAKQQAQQEAVEAALTRSDTRRSIGSGKEDIVLVGNLIGEGHVNYIMMYNMLTGIRVGVSRCQAKIKRALTPEDFKAAHKMSFDIVGNELTPSAKYDFKFKDYAPWVFRSLREDIFHLDPADYLLSLTAKYILSELGSPGKSGSFFYFSRDYRFIIKTIRHAEHKFLLSILDKYYKHVQSNPHTLLSRFYGLHRIKLPRGRKIHFVIMNNLFPPHRDIHETYDLKGSTVGREFPEDKAQKNPRAVLKDLNWINRGKMLELGPEKRAFLTEQLRRDAEFLKTVNVMDYSLLVGIHNMRRGNRDNVRKNTLKVFSPDIPRPHRKLASDPAIVRRAMRNSQTKNLGEGKNSVKLPDEVAGEDERSHFLFYQDEGGLRATDEFNDPEDTIYYLGIIDILTPWGAVKKLERVWKGLSADRHKISPVAPAEYSQRFFNFMKAIMRGGEGGAKFKPE